MSDERYEISECELDVLAITGPEGTRYIDGEEIEARVIRQQSADLDKLRAELERAAAEPEPVAWMWNDELGIPHASAGSKKPVWLESSASAEYIKQANLRPLYAVPPVPVAKIREPTDDECRNIWREAKANEGDGSKVCAGRAMFDAVKGVLWPKEGL